MVFHSLLEPLQREVELQLNDVIPLLYPCDQSGAFSLVEVIEKLCSDWLGP